MLESYIHNRRKFQFIDSQRVNEKSNIFTILVGKNGSGKSRLLSAIASEFISSPNKFQRETLSGFSSKDHLDYSFSPTRIITVSTSPFDRFPILRRNEKFESYSYLGLRDLQSQNFGLAYMSKIISSLIEAFIEDAGQMYDITSVLSHLGYTDTIQIRLEPRMTSRLANALLESSDTYEKFDEAMRNMHFGFNSTINKRYFYTEEDRLDTDKVDKLVYILRSSYDFQRKKHIRLDINSNGIIPHDLFQISPPDLIFLIHSGIVRLREANLEKINSGNTFSISDASSGEQAIVLGFLGIASKIKDGCLICIDEPEICLHPEWQEKYITMLFSAFSRYRRCHFLIATHSPQIISNLEPDNCFILSMDDGSIVSAKELVNHSADFQLASVFNAPGFKNEYLARIALNIFAKASANRNFDDDDTKNLSILLGQEKSLETSDPVYLLLTTLKAMRKEYARHK